MSWLTTTTLLLLAAVMLFSRTGVAAEREIWEDIKDMDIFRIKYRSLKLILLKPNYPAFLLVEF